MRVILARSFRLLGLIFGLLAPSVALTASEPPPKILSSRPLTALHERMALQGVPTEKGVLLLGGFTYPERSCLREISLFTKEGAETALKLKMAVGRNHFRAVTLGADRVLVIAGFSEDYGSLAEVELLDFTKGTVEAWPWLKLPTELFSIAELPGKIAVIGGLMAQGATQTWDAIQLIDLKMKEVSLAPQKLATSRFGHESVWLPELKKVLIVGGKNVSRSAPDANGRRKLIWTSLKSMEFWDPATGAITSAGELTAARDRPLLHRLADGKVLVIGGATEEPNAVKLASIELYDPQTQRSKVVAQMSVGRMAATALPYKTQGLLIAGGWVDDAEKGKAIEYLDFATLKTQVLGNASSTRAESVMAWLRPSEFLLIGGKDSFGSRDPHSYSFKTGEVVKLAPPQD